MVARWWHNAAPANNAVMRFSRLPLRRARRVKKICRWHIFSPSGKQAMLATRAEGCRGATEGECRLREGSYERSLPPPRASRGSPPSSEGGKEACANIAATCCKSRMVGRRMSSTTPSTPICRFTAIVGADPYVRVIPSEPIKASRGISTERRTRGRGVNTLSFCSKILKGL